MKVPFLDLRQQYATIQAEIDEAVHAVLDSQQFILGETVEKFEREFAGHLGVRHAIGVGSGLAALELVLETMKLWAQHNVAGEVIVPTNTFFASLLAVSRCQSTTPVLVDCDNTYNIDPEQVEAAITPRTRAIMPVHLTGQPCDMAAIMEIAGRHNLIVIEDACQAHGATFEGRACGTIGNAGCFSFYPSKNLGCYGDGGMITTNDDDLAARLRAMRNYGSDRKYRHILLGSNSRLDAIQAAVLSVKLQYLARWNTMRRIWADWYRLLLKDVPGVTLQQLVPYATHVYHLMCIEVEDRSGLRRHLELAGIQTGVHYPIPCHLQPIWREISYTREGAFPRAELLARRTLSLPMYPELGPKQVGYVCDKIKEFMT